ncbi:Uncharacterised protein [Candidatus Gugararchaeum adminiculabundum]|nr:Uncharacterised protein [Candidatus Gugararchaeum adminiculabundum]
MENLDQKPQRTEPHKPLSQQAKPFFQALSQPLPGLTGLDLIYPKFPQFGFASASINTYASFFQQMDAELMSAMIYARIREMQDTSFEEQMRVQQLVFQPSTQAMREKDFLPKDKKGGGMAMRAVQNEINLMAREGIGDSWLANQRNLRVTCSSFMEATKANMNSLSNPYGTFLLSAEVTRSGESLAKLNTKAMQAMVKIQQQYFKDQAQGIPCMRLISSREALALYFQENPGQYQKVLGEFLKLPASALSRFSENDLKAELLRKGRNRPDYLATQVKKALYRLIGKGKAKETKSAISARIDNDSGCILIQPNEGIGKEPLLNAFKKLASKNQQKKTRKKKPQETPAQESAACLGQ